MQTQNQINPTTNSKTSSTSMQSCIQNCYDCFKSCSQMIEHCLIRGGDHASASHIKILQDCAMICNLSSDFMIRNSENHADICQVCADICEACAQSCDLLASDDTMMQTCAVVCRQSASSCKTMSSMQ